MNDFILVRMSRMPGHIHGAIKLIAAFSFSFLFFFGHGEATDEINKALAIGLRWYGRYLGFVVGQAFPKVLGTLDEAVLKFSLATAPEIDWATATYMC